jgi:hypothetical protein
MAESGDWVTPYVNGVRFLEKPPLLYWLTAASFKAFGINEFALRLPTALAVIALVWVVMLIARRVADARTAFIAGLSTAFSTGTYIFTRETLHDIWLVLFVALAMYAFIDWHLDPRHSRCKALLFYAATAGAVMCKSLIGVVFPLGIVVVFFLRSQPFGTAVFSIFSLWASNSCAFSGIANHPFSGPFHFSPFGRSSLSGCFPGRHFCRRRSPRVANRMTPVSVPFLDWHWRGPASFWVFSPSQTDWSITPFRRFRRSRCL